MFHVKLRHSASRVARWKPHRLREVCHEELGPWPSAPRLPWETVALTCCWRLMRVGNMIRAAAQLSPNGWGSARVVGIRAR